MMIHEQEAEEALGKWSSSKYALLEGMRNTGLINALVGSVPDWLEGKYTGWKFDPFGVAYAKDGAVFLTAQNKPYLYLLSSDREDLTLIKDDLPSTNGKLDYNHVRDTVLWSVAGAVKEIDRDGNVVNSLSTGQKGNAGHWTGEGKFALVVPSEHYAFEMDWQGNELWSFGTQGTSGDDLTHLNAPWDVCSPSEGVYVIADRENDRLVVDGDGDGTAEQINVVSQPFNVESVRPTSNLLVSTEFSNEYPWLTLLLGSTEGDNKILGAVPAHSNDLSVHPTLPLFSLVQHVAFEEIGLRSLKERPLDPQELKPLDGQTIAAGSTVTTRPMVVAPYDKMSVYSVGDQTHDVTIERLRTKRNLYIGATAPPVYDDLDTLSISSANTLEGWHKGLTARLFVVRLTVENTSGSSGTFNTWVSFK